MQKILSLTCISIILTISTVRANSLLDSIGVENLNGKKVVLHKIDPSETYYALGRKYNVAPKDIISFNNNKTLVPGVIIKVPTQLPFTSQAAVSTESGAQKTHIVKAKENLSIISNLYGITVAQLKEANQLNSNNLSIGQKLIIPGTAPSLPTAAAQVVNTTPNTPVYTPPVVNKPANTTITNFVEHAVKPKEYLNKIAQDYNTTVEAIKSANNLTSNSLKIGQILKIPTESTNVAANTNAPVSTTPVITNPTPTNSNVTSQNAPNTSGRTHTVSAGETIFSIAQRYALTAFQLREANNLTDNTINVGQVLKVPGSSMTGVSVPEANRNTTFADTVETISDPNLRRSPSVYGLNHVEEKGTAVWIEDPDLDPTKMLVLHRTLPIGTIIMVKNPMGNISTFAKVVGKFTENETTKDVIIVVTKAVAEKLGVLDKRFFCNLSYASQGNDK